MTKLKTRSFASFLSRNHYACRGKVGKDALLTAGMATNWRDADGKKSGFFRTHQHSEVSIL